jgi:hypothetical protein
VLQKSETAPVTVDPLPPPLPTAATEAVPTATPVAPVQKKGKKKKWGAKDEEPFIVVETAPQAKEIIDSVRAFY